MSNWYSPFRRRNGFEARSELEILRLNIRKDAIISCCLVVFNVEISGNFRVGILYMERAKVLLATLAVSGGREFTPAQLQKAMFLLNENMPTIFDTTYSFVPYNYGPFDASVYHDAEHLEREGLTRIYNSNRGNWKVYSCSPLGVARGNAELANFSQIEAGYIQRVSEWVLSQDFSSLVKSIYNAYPSMRANSIFAG